MDKFFFNPSKTEVDSIAEDIFSKRAGLEREGSKIERMREAGFSVRDSIEERINLKGESAFLGRGEFTLEGDELVISDVRLKCRAFELLNKDSIYGVYLYACTAGDYDLPDRELMEQLYADMWGGAYADALRILMENRFRQKSGDEGLKLSESFGPGFYGMDVSETVKFAEILDFKEMGISLNSSGIMIPVKSCAGLFFTVGQGYSGTGAVECRACLGNHQSCRLCKVFMEMNGGTH